MKPIPEIGDSAANHDKPAEKIPIMPAMLLSGTELVLLTENIYMTIMLT
jgi:hypothetical protein